MILTGHYRVHRPRCAGPAVWEPLRMPVPSAFAHILPVDSILGKRKARIGVRPVSARRPPGTRTALKPGKIHLPSLRANQAPARYTPLRNVQPVDRALLTPSCTVRLSFRQLFFPTCPLAERSISGCRLTARESRSGPMLAWLYKSQVRNSRSSRNWRSVKTSAYTASGL